jgi:hypothetical protein
MPTTLTPFDTADCNLYRSVKQSGMSDSTAKQELLANLEKHADRIFQDLASKYQDFEILFSAVLKSQVFGIHKNSYESFFHIFNTRSKQKAMGIVRDKACLVFEREFRASMAINDFQAAANQARVASDKPIFSEPRQNWFKRFEGMTNTQRKIEELLDEMEEAMKKIPHAAYSRPLKTFNSKSRMA